MGQIRLMESPFFVVIIELNRFANQAEFFGQQDWDACRREGVPNLGAW